MTLSISERKELRVTTAVQHGLAQSGLMTLTRCEREEALPSFYSARSSANAHVCEEAMSYAHVYGLYVLSFPQMSLDVDIKKRMPALTDDKFVSIHIVLVFYRYVLRGRESAMIFFSCGHPFYI